MTSGLELGEAGAVFKRIYERVGPEQSLVGEAGAYSKPVCAGAAQL